MIAGAGGPGGPGRVVVGLDACRGGWVCVRLVDGRVDEVEVVEEAGEALADDVVIAGIDIPIGLVDTPGRDADRAARDLLRGRASSVFSAPPRAVVAAYVAGTLAEHAEATALARATTGKGISQQAWRLTPKIAEVDALAAAGHPVREVHPEVAFALVAGEPLPRKVTWAGIETRRAVLRPLGLELPDRFPGDDRAAPDDVLDAAVVAWVADGIATGEGALTIPDTTDQRDHGRPIQIHARIPPSAPSPGRQAGSLAAPPPTPQAGAGAAPPPEPPAAG